MKGVQLTNNAFATLAAGIVAGDLTIALTAGQGARFPSLSANDYFMATLVDNSNNLEIVQITARATDSLTAVRGLDGTSARSYSAGDRLELRLCNQTMNAFAQEALQAVAGSGTDTYTGTLSPAPKGYNTGQIYAVKFPNPNTSTAPTINLNSFGAKTIKRVSGSILIPGDITSNMPGLLYFDGTDMLLLNPAAVLGTQGQIKFPATQNDAADANTLDDYEEGTWTPGMEFGGGTTGITYAEQLGDYTKIGRHVALTYSVAMTSKGSSTGGAKLTGIPFTLGGSVHFTSSHVYWTNTATNVITVQVFPSTAGASKAVFHGTVAAASNLVSLTDAHFGNLSQTVGGFNYPV